MNKIQAQVTHERITDKHIEIEAMEVFKANIAYMKKHHVKTVFLHSVQKNLGINNDDFAQLIKDFRC